MNIVSFVDKVRVQFAKSSGKTISSIPPYSKYVFGRPQYSALELPYVKSKIWRTASLYPRLKPFDATCYKYQGHKVLIYNGCGGYGDQIMTWPVAKWLSNYYKVYVLSDPGNEICWELFPWVNGIYTLPIQYEFLEFFDHLALFDVVTNVDDQQDQQHPVDTMFNMIGVDPDSVDAADKVVSPNFSAVEMELQSSMYVDKPFAIYQLHSGSKIRSLLPKESAYIFHGLAKAFPNIEWVGVHDMFSGQDYAKEASNDKPENTSIVCSDNIRVLWALAQRAKVVVAPDSMMTHIAGSMSIPSVGLWGPTKPELRSAYYTNHTPIFLEKACSQAGCMVFTSAFPRYCPPMQNRRQCDVLSSITLQAAVDAVKAKI